MFFSNFHTLSNLILHFCVLSGAICSGLTLQLLFSVDQSTTTFVLKTWKTKNQCIDLPDFWFASYILILLSQHTIFSLFPISIANPWNQRSDTKNYLKFKCSFIFVMFISFSGHERFSLLSINSFELHFRTFLGCFKFAKKNLFCLTTVAIFPTSCVKTINISQGWISALKTLMHQLPKYRRNQKEW